MICLFLDTTIYRTECVFSPDDQLIGTVISCDRGQTEGQMVFFRREGLHLAHAEQVADTVSLNCLVCIYKYTYYDTGYCTLFFS